MFNRIYEEWKRKKGVANMKKGFGSIESMRNGNPASATSRRHGKTTFNRIYEEWKLYHVHGVCGLSTTFNRIYEEWKHDYPLGEPILIFGVQSNLWGMETRTVPFYPRTALFVQSNLWGMETTFLGAKFRGRGWVQSNLWGMETPVAIPRSTSSSKFNRIYEEWKPLTSTDIPQLASRSIESMRNGNVVLPGGL